MIADYDRRISSYQDAKYLNQAMLDETFRGGEIQICTVGILSKIVDGIQHVLRFSDRAQFVGNNFYHGRAKFPDMKRTVGELVSPQIQFSEMELELSNVDGFYNRYLSSGQDYFSFIGSTVRIMVGISDNVDTYRTIFFGYVPDEDGFSLNKDFITIRAREKADGLNRATGLPTINIIDYPSAPDDSIGKVIPFAIGDWTVGYNVEKSSGSTSINYADLQFNVIVDSPKNFFGGLIGYFVGGTFFVFSIGTFTPEAILDCHVKRGDTLFQVNFVPTPQSAAGYWVVQVLSFNVFGGGELPYVYQDGDVATISVKIPYRINSYSNPVDLAKEILIRLGGMNRYSDFDDASWENLAGKNSPEYSAINSIAARVWIGEDADNILEEVLSLLEQVRIELYWNTAQQIAIRSLHPEDFASQGSFKIEQYNIDETSLKIDSDQRNFFNVAMANYSFSPILGKTQLQTKKRKNQNSIDKSGKKVVKVIDLPSLYVESDARNQLDEFVKFYSTGHQYVSFAVAWTALLCDLTDIVKLSYSIGSVNYKTTPMKIRDITFKPDTGCLVFKLLSFENFPYTGNKLDYEAKMLSSEAQQIEDE